MQGRLIMSHSCIQWSYQEARWTLIMQCHVLVCSAIEVPQHLGGHDLLLIHYAPVDVKLRAGTDIPVGSDRGLADIMGILIQTISSCEVLWFCEITWY